MICAKKTQTILSPEQLLARWPCPQAVRGFIVKTRETIANLIHRRDPRLLIVLGPCSIHDPKSALEYAQRVAIVSKKYADKLFLVMRTYFEKPRTHLGWKGLIYDPALDGSSDLNRGLQQARQLLLTINGLGVPTATEWLDTLIPFYLADLIAWGAIGARTTESQIHRQLASGLSMPVGFKNNTQGFINTALDAITVAKENQHMFGIDHQGMATVLETMGNQNGHLVLRGGFETGPNYDHTSLDEATLLLEQYKIPTGIMIDCSHGNSGKNPENQKKVLLSVSDYIRKNSQNKICGLMLESHLHAGNQPLSLPLQYGVSVTDACMSWEDTLALLDELYFTFEPVCEIY